GWKGGAAGRRDRKDSPTRCLPQRRPVRGAWLVRQPAHAQEQVTGPIGTPVRGAAPQEVRAARGLAAPAFRVGPVIPRVLSRTSRLAGAHRVDDRWPLSPGTTAPH